ncbi:MAG: type II toxin-antitoxin system RelE/ParE family toxin [Balneolaceae bacterium]
MKVFWSLTAKNKIKEILDYISEKDPDAALALIDMFKDKVEKLKQNPESGRVLPETNHDKIREIVVHKNYGIIYEINPDIIKILTVRHFRQDVSASKL